MQRLYGREGRRVRVFSLGVRGAGTDQYLESLSRVPESRKAGVVILSFYPNDLTPRPRPPSKALHLAQRVTWPLGRSSLSFRAVHDLLGKIETPSIEEYHRGLVEDYRKDEPSFHDRWAALVGDLDRFAKRRSAFDVQAPAHPDPADGRLSRLPPVAAAREDLRQAAGQLGYDVLNLLPPFRATLVDGRRYRVAAGDNHCNAFVHEFIAGLIKRRLDARPGTPGLRAGATVGEGY